MHSAIRIPAAVLALALAAAAQSSDLPPGILVLARVKAHLRQELARLPNCSCLETVRREIKMAGQKPTPLDIVRLEVLYSEGKEMYAPPGDRKFVAEHPSSFTGGGMIGDGFFALYLSDVVSEGRVEYEYKGEEDLLRRRVARYDFRLPVSMSGHAISLAEGTGVVGETGSFWADPATYDIVRLEMHATEIPPNLPLAESSNTVDYVRVKLGDSEFLLPRTAGTRVVRLNGEENVNSIEFTQCHLYSAESSVSFGMQEARPQFGIAVASETELQPLPALEITTSLVSPITPQASVGSLIFATVSGNVSRKGKVLIPGGSTVRGIVRRLEYNAETGYYVVGLEFTDIDAAGVRYRFFADLQSMDVVRGVDFKLLVDSGNRRVTELTLPPLPGVGLFFVAGKKLDLPKGFRMTWKTRSLVP